MDEMSMTCSGGFPSATRPVLAPRRSTSQCKQNKRRSPPPQDNSPQSHRKLRRNGGLHSRRVRSSGQRTPAAGALRGQHLRVCEVNENASVEVWSIYPPARSTGASGTPARPRSGPFGMSRCSHLHRVLCNTGGHQSPDGDLLSDLSPPHRQLRGGVCVR